MKKIALINDYPRNTGIGNYAFSLFEELKNEKNFKMEMLYLNCEKIKQKNENALEINSKYSFPLLNKTLHNVFVFPKIIPKNFELFHCSNQFISNIAKYNKPCIVSCMDIIPKVLPKGYSATMRFFLNNAMKNMNEAEKIITISKFTKNEIIEHYNIPENKITPTYLGYDSKVFKKRDKKNARKKLNLPEKEKIVLNVGSEEERKNIHTVLRAIAIAKKNFPEIKFVRIGEQRAGTKNLIGKLGLAKNVKYFDSVDPNKLSFFYNSADVFAFASYYEGFGLPLLEALASGTPSISTKRTSIPEIAGKATETFEPFDEKRLCEKILKILGDEKIQNKLSKKGLEQAKKFSWKKCANETEKVYRGFLE